MELKIGQDLSVDDGAGEVQRRCHRLSQTFGYRYISGCEDAVCHLSGMAHGGIND